MGLWRLAFMGLLHANSGYLGSSHKHWYRLWSPRQRCSCAVAASGPENDSATITIQHESQLGADVVNHNGLIDSKPILTKVIYLGVRSAL